MNSRGERISGSRSCQRMAAADLTFNNSSGAGIGRMALAIVCCGRRKFVKINYFNILSGEGCLSDPSPPPLAFAKAFSRFGCGRIFPLFSRVMRVGLSTGGGARRPASCLLGPIFSEPNDCARLVNFL